MDLPEIEQAFVDYQALVRHTVHVFEQTHPQLARVLDCLEEGFVAFLNAYQAYQKNPKNIKFSTYLSYRVRYHLLDLSRTKHVRRQALHVYTDMQTTPVEFHADQRAVDIRLDNPEGFKDYKEAKKYVCA